MVIALSYASNEVRKFYFLETLKEFWKRICTRHRIRKMETIMLSRIKNESIYLCVKSRRKEIVLKRAFNDNLVIQYYKGRGKEIIIFVPPKWEGDIKVHTVYGNIKCSKNILTDKIFLESKHGEILYEDSQESVVRSA